MTKYIKIKLHSLNFQILDLYSNFLITLFKNLNITFKKSYLPTKKKKFTFLRSPHVYKTAREQFEFNRYNFVFFIHSSMDFLKIKNFLVNKPFEIKTTLCLVTKPASFKKQ